MDLEMMLHKPNQLITITGELTQNQIKLYDCILFNIKEELRKDKNKRRFHLNYTDIKNNSGVEDKNNSRVSGYMKKLTSIGISYGDQRGNFGGFSLISEYDKKDNVLEIVLPSKIIDVLISGNYYTTMQILEQKLLKGKYSIFLYQYLKRNNFRGDHIITIKELKEIFNIKEGSSYDKDFGKLNNRILIPSVEEIKENTNLDFKLIEHRTGKKVTKIEIKFYKVIDTKTIEEIQLCTNTKEIINKILKTDLIFIDGKRVNRVIFEGAIKDLNKQHKKPDIIIKVLKKLVKENKKSVNPANLKSYIWNIAKSIIDIPEKDESKKQIESKDLQGIEPEVEVFEELREEIRDPKNEESEVIININDYNDKDIIKAMKLCSEKEETSIKFLEDLRKKSDRVFIATIKHYLPFQKYNMNPEPAIKEMKETVMKIDWKISLFTAKSFFKSGRITEEKYNNTIEEIINGSNLTSEEFDEFMEMLSK